MENEKIKEIKKWLQADDWVDIDRETIESAKEYLRSLVKAAENDTMPAEDEAWWDVNSMDDFYQHIRVHGFRYEDWCKYVDIEWPSGEPLRLYIPPHILGEMEDDFYETYPDDDFDPDYMGARVTMWNGVQKQVKVSDGEWEYYLPFEVHGDYAIAVDSIIS